MQISGITGATTRKTVTLINYQAGKAVPEVTELISPSGTITQGEIDKLYKELVACAPTFGAILLMGTWPKGVTRDFYAGLAAAKGESSFVLLGELNMDLRSHLPATQPPSRYPPTRSSKTPFRHATTSSPYYWTGT